MPEGSLLSRERTGSAGLLRVHGGTHEHADVGPLARGDGVPGGRWGRWLRCSSAAASCRAAKAGRGAGSSAAASLRMCPAGRRATFLRVGLGRLQSAGRQGRFGREPQIQEVLARTSSASSGAAPAGRARTSWLRCPEPCPPSSAHPPTPSLAGPSPPAAPPVYCVCAAVSGDLASPLPSALSPLSLAVPFFLQTFQ